ncbi:MAG TPA: hypothetical protein ENG40_04020, partial [Thermoprotei archaeon]|nr:hypothetical protein [Thermoprotei archaeon]
MSLWSLHAYSPYFRERIKKRKVYLPRGTWYYYWNMRKYCEGEIDIEAPLNIIPIFIREGAIIPTQPVMEYIG